MVLSTITRSLLKDNNNVVNICGNGPEFKLLTNGTVFDSDGLAMVVGDEYEMYEPTALMAHERLGLQFKRKDYKFIYLGVIDHAEGGPQYIASRDVLYDASKIPPEVYRGSLVIAQRYDGAFPVCPLAIAAKTVRRATD